jgi:hypothetical protein
MKVQIGYSVRRKWAKVRLVWEVLVKGYGACSERLDRIEAAVACNEDLCLGERVGCYTWCFAAGHVAKLAVDIQKSFVIAIAEARFDWLVAGYEQKVEPISYRMEG